MSGYSIDRPVYDQMVALCFEAYPLEGCGMLAGPPEADRGVQCYPAKNAAESSRVYTIDPRDQLRADRDAEARGLEINAVFHSHTHTPAYPSPTDVGQAPVPEWHYLLVSFAEEEPSVRSFRISEGEITEEQITVVEC